MTYSAKDVIKNKKPHWRTPHNTELSPCHLSRSPGLVTYSAKDVLKNNKLHWRTPHNTELSPCHLSRSTGLVRIYSASAARLESFENCRTAKATVHSTNSRILKRRRTVSLRQNILYCLPSFLMNSRPYSRHCSCIASFGAQLSRSPSSITSKPEACSRSEIIFTASPLQP